VSKGLGWLDVTELPIDWLYMLEKEHLKWTAAGWKDNAPRERSLGICLNHHPTLLWYFKTFNPEDALWFQRIAEAIDEPLSAAEIRQAEVEVLNWMNDWLVYIINPQVYLDLPFTQWSEQELTNMADFHGKRVLDIGAGPGLLTFIAAKTARAVYAVEPVSNLRRFIRKRAVDMGYRHVYAVDGLITAIPFEDKFADLTMAGHVCGDDWEGEIEEMRRVTAPGGMIVLHPATNDSETDQEGHTFLVNKGFRWQRFEEPEEGWKRSYWITV